jgi:hypothetical protein
VTFPERAGNSSLIVFRGLNDQLPHRRVAGVALTDSCAMLFLANLLQPA